jgi:SPP1 gp7 family putative phage head morphogenesis protein
VPTPIFSVANNLEAAYRNEIYKIVKTWIPFRLKDMSPDHWLRELSNVSTRKSISAASAKVALNMITKINVVNLRSWRQAAFDTQGGPQLYRLLREEFTGNLGKQLREYVADNARHIQEIPYDVATELLGEISKAANQGTRPEAIYDILKFRFPQVMDSKIKMIARTGINSANTTISRIRCSELGIPCFVWKTSEDGRVRPSHKVLDGVVIFWKDLPSPEALIGQKAYLGHYAPGSCPNCRCHPRPVLTLEDIFDKKNTPIRVFMDGRIDKFTRQEFAKMSGIESRLAA